MKNLQKMGGVAAIALTLIYLIGMVVNFTFLDTSSLRDPVELVSFLAGWEGVLYASTTLLYVVFAVVLAVLTLALYNKFTGKEKIGAQLIGIFGVIWSCLLFGSGMVYNVGVGMAIDLLQTEPESAAHLYRAVNAMHIGLGGGNEIPGALWTLAISVTAMRLGYFGKVANIMGIVIGVAGLLTIVPDIFMIAVMIFALGQMVWWIIIGIHMIRQASEVSHEGTEQERKSAYPQPQ